MKPEQNFGNAAIQALYCEVATGVVESNANIEWGMNATIPILSGLFEGWRKITNVMHDNADPLLHMPCTDVVIMEVNKQPEP